MSSRELLAGRADTVKPHNPFDQESRDFSKAITTFCSRTPSPMTITMQPLLYRRLVAACALAALLLTTLSSSFSPLPRLDRFKPATTSFLLSAKASNRKRSKQSATTKSSGAAGFGVVPSNAQSSASSTKVRSVSGHTGSGTKPLRDAANTFDRLRKSQHGSSECCNDVYVRSPNNNSTLFWFVGKVARCMDEEELVGDSIPTEMEAALSQKRLILEYSKTLRPQNLGGVHSSSLELWLAPGDSEMDVVQNKVTLQKVVGSTSHGLSATFHVKDVGYNPEIYTGDEITQGGLRVVRDEQGRPVKPVFEVNQSA
jgi:hypothetical protein